MFLCEKNVVNVLICEIDHMAFAYETKMFIHHFVARFVLVDILVATVFEFYEVDGFQS